MVLTALCLLQHSAEFKQVIFKLNKSFKIEFCEIVFFAKGMKLIVILRQGGLRHDTTEHRVCRENPIWCQLTGLHRMLTTWCAETVRDWLSVSVRWRPADIAGSRRRRTGNDVIDGERRRRSAVSAIYRRPRYFGYCAVDARQRHCALVTAHVWLTLYSDIIQKGL